MDGKKLEGCVSVPVKLYPWWVYLKNPEGSRFPFFPFCLFFFFFVFNFYIMFVHICWVSQHSTFATLETYYVGRVTYRLTNHFECL